MRNYDDYPAGMLVNRVKALLVAGVQVQSAASPPPARIDVKRLQHPTTPIQKS
jgi:hypothetical protein